MDNGWIKSYRKAQFNKIWEDKNAWRLFQWLMWNVDYKTGIGTFGKKQLSEGTGIKIGTIYKVVTRIQNKYSVASCKSSQLYTEIRLLNWAKYQQTEEIVVTSVQKKKSPAYKKGSPIKEYKNIRNKEYIERENASLSYLKNIPVEDVNSFLVTTSATESQIREKALSLVDYCESHGKKYKNYEALLRNALRKDYPKAEKIEMLSNLI